MLHTPRLQRIALPPNRHRNFQFPYHRVALAISIGIVIAIAIMNRLTTSTMQQSQRRGGGMQVHAVPESERAVDANGQKLPWAYEYAE